MPHLRSHSVNSPSMNWEALPRQVPIKATEMTHPLACVACVQRVVGAKPPRMDDFEKFELCQVLFLHQDLCSGLNVPGPFKEVFACISAAKSAFPLLQLLELDNLIFELNFTSCGQGTVGLSSGSFHLSACTLCRHRKFGSKLPSCMYRHKQSQTHKHTLSLNLLVQMSVGTVIISFGSMSNFTDMLLFTV